jgi:hypothetical protein
MWRCKECGRVVEFQVKLSSKSHNFVDENGIFDFSLRGLGGVEVKEIKTRCKCKRCNGVAIPNLRDVAVWETV